MDFATIWQARPARKASIFAVDDRMYRSDLPEKVMPLHLYLACLATCMIMAITPAFAETGQTCMATDAESQASCLSMIGAVRELTQGDTSNPACAASSGDDLATTEAVIDWIKAHPERADSDLAVLIREALITVDPCAQGPLIPTLKEPSDLDVE